MVLRLPWLPGPAAAPAGEPVLVSFTEFTYRVRDLPAIWWAGLRLRRRLAKLPGAVGVSLWIAPLKGRSGSISVWESEDDLRRFVGLPYHVVIMRRFRGRGRLRSAKWRVHDFDLGEAYAEARRRV